MNPEMNGSVQSRGLDSGGQDTPENEVSVEGIRGYTDSEGGLADIGDRSVIENMKREQKHMLQCFEKTNEMLLHCSALSQNRVKLLREEYLKHLKLLNEMKNKKHTSKKVRTTKPKSSVKKAVKASSIAATNTDLKKETSDPVSSKNQSTQEKVSGTGSKATTTVEYVQMEEAQKNGKPIENELIERLCSIELSNSNASSDCTLEDTG